MLLSTTTSAMGLLSLMSLSTASEDVSCRAIPGDEAWPSVAEWNALNETVDGQLIATVPIGAPCHNSYNGVSTFDEEACAALKNVWFLPETHYPTSSSPMAYPFSNNSCNPFVDPDVACTIGYYVAYAINVTEPAHVQAGINFSNKHNVRLVVRNTGHDYLGRSTGAHGLAIWTHGMQSIDKIDFNGPTYSGPALKLGAGVMAIDAYTFADEHGLQVVGGNCPTVGLAGGYSSGGGHGPLASKHGLGADQVLEFEIVTADGQILTANDTSNADLFWALRGGGGGNYGVVLSATVKAFPDTYATTAAMSVNVNDDGTNTDTIYEFLASFLTGTVPSLVDKGVYVLFTMTSLGFALTPAFAPGMHQAELDALLQPALDKLNELSLAFTYSSSENATFLGAYNALPTMWNVSDFNTGGRLIDREMVFNKTDDLIAAIRNIGSEGLFSGVCLNVSQSVSSPDEVAVNPYFRTSLFNAFYGLATDYTSTTADQAAMDHITNDLTPPLAALTPGSGGAYMNEADVQEPDFQFIFYGAHYDRLLEIKRKYDPRDIFYARTAVGSDAWYEQSDGRLCRV
ncbi:FAD-binding domain-containing protein [Xylaria sp. CBS 124048]|nr:FAD-binding domain-containing protein [Xylaria sp. CBS 124048]